MELGSLIAFNAALLVALITPGPALLLALRTALTEGRLAAVMCDLGLAMMAACWTLLALLGLDRVFALVPFAYVSLKLIGAAYLIWIAIQTWRQAREPIRPETSSSGRAFLRGWLLNLSNPKSVLFAAAVLVVIFPPNLTGLQMAAITVNHVIIEVAFYLVFTTLMSSDAARRRYLEAKPVLDRTAAVVMAGLGLRLLVAR